MQKGLNAFEMEPPSSDYFPVEIDQIPFVMAIIGAGIFLAFILFTIELIFIKCCRRRKKVVKPYFPCRRKRIIKVPLQGVSFKK